MLEQLKSLSSSTQFTYMVLAKIFTNTVDDGSSKEN